MNANVGRLRALMSGPVGGQPLLVALERIEPDPDQPRRVFAPESLAELAQSIARNGVIQPVIVRPHPEQAGNYRLVAGERRWRAAQHAGCAEIPVLVREEAPPETLLTLQLIENLDREDLSPRDEAAAIVRLLSHGLSGNDVAVTLGRSKSWVSLRRKVGENADLLQPFHDSASTRDIETLAMLVDLEPLDAATFAALSASERVGRAEVREALERARAGGQGRESGPGPQAAVRREERVRNLLEGLEAPPSKPLTGLVKHLRGDAPRVDVRALIELPAGEWSLAIALLKAARARR